MSSTHRAEVSWSVCYGIVSNVIFGLRVAHTHARTRTCTRTHTHAHVRTRPRAPARTHAHERPTTNDATCGPPAWLTGTLHDRGIRSVPSPRNPYRHALARRPPRKARPFCFLNYYKTRICNVSTPCHEQWGVRHDLYARTRELPFKFERVETVDVETLPRRVRRENPDLTSLETKKRSWHFLSHFHRKLELRVPRRPRSFAKRVRKWTISKEKYHTPLCGYVFSFKNISQHQHNLAGASVLHDIANALELLSSSLVMETIARQSSHHPRRAFNSISHAARVWFLGGLVFVASQWRSLRFCGAESHRNRPLGFLISRSPP